jgi:hypothetical protein
MRDALADPDYFGAIYAGESRAAWRVLLVAICGEELTPDEREVFTQLTGREREPGKMVSEFWGIMGRRGGKTEAMAILAAYISGCWDHVHLLGVGERGRLPVMASTKAQAKQAFDFIRGVFEESPFLSTLVESVTADTISLKNRIDIEVIPASHRTGRSFTSIALLCDEMAYWDNSEDAANPAKEVLRALRPTRNTTGGPLVVISTPRAKTGPLWDAFRRHYGPDGSKSILVARAPSRIMNPSLSQYLIDSELKEDEENARSEYLVEWRDDLEVFISRERIEDAIESGVTVRPPVPGVFYSAFVDLAGGSGGDSATLAVCHLEGVRVVLDLIVERKPKFSPMSVVAEFCETLKQYNVRTVVGDRYSDEWSREQFRASGVLYQVSEPNKSDLYNNFLPVLNSGRVSLLDNQRMISQFCGLDRRSGSSGRDTVDHRRGEHDDIANAVAGAVVNCQKAMGPIRISDSVKAWMSQSAAVAAAAERAGLPNPNRGRPMRCFPIGHL